MQEFLAVIGALFLLCAFVGAFLFATHFLHERGRESEHERRKREIAKLQRTTVKEFDFPNGIEVQVKVTAPPWVFDQADAIEERIHRDVRRIRETQAEAK